MLTVLYGVGDKLLLLAVTVATVVIALVGLEAEEVEIGTNSESPLPSELASGGGPVVIFAVKVTVGIFVIVSATIPLPYQHLLAPTSQTRTLYSSTWHVSFCCIDSQALYNLRWLHLTTSMIVA